MKMDKLFVEFCEKIKTKSRTLPQFLAPFIGILVNLYSRISDESLTAAIQANSTSLDNLASLFNRIDSFDPNLFNSCFLAVYSKLPPTNEREKEYFKKYEQMMEEIDILVQRKLIRKDSIDSNGVSLQTGKENEESKNEPEIDDELLCKICFNREIDTAYQPCDHNSCLFCIQTHMLNM